jgi:hypothetical protein
MIYLGDKMKKIMLVLSMSLIVSSAFSTVTLTESGKSGTTVTIGYSYNGSGGFPNAFGLVLQATGGTITLVTPAKIGKSTSEFKGFGIFPSAISIDDGNVTTYGTTPVEPNGLPGGPSALGTSRVIVSLGAIYADASGKPNNSGSLFTVVCSSGTTGLSAAAISEDAFREGVVDVNGVVLTVSPLNVTFPTPPGQATNQSPANNSTGQSRTPTLTWTVGSNTSTQNIYLSTSNPPTVVQSGAPNTQTTYTPGSSLAANTKYYWRIDEINSSGTTAGVVWNFTTAAAPGLATNPSPSSITPTLTWTAGSGTTSHNVYFGTDSTPDATEYIGNQAGTTYVPGTLTNNTIYYWRIDEVGPGGTTTGTVWRFTTIGPPTFVAAGSITSGTGTITPTLPTGRATNDILLLFVETSNQAVTISNQNGGTWNEVTNSQYCGIAADTTGVRLTVFWSRYNGTQGAPTVSDSGDHQQARMIAIRGATTTGNPWDVTAGGVEAVTDANGSIPGATTTVGNCLVVTAIATSLPDLTSTTRFSAWTNANLTSITERTDNSVTAGNGGGLGIATGIKATAGAYGNTAVTLATSAYKGMMSIAIKP